MLQFHGDTCLAMERQHLFQAYWPIISATHPSFPIVHHMVMSEVLAWCAAHIGIGWTYRQQQNIVYSCIHKHCVWALSGRLPFLVTHTEPPVQQVCTKLHVCRPMSARGTPSPDNMVYEIARQNKHRWLRDIWRA